MTKLKTTLLRQWIYNDKPYRLISTPTYEYQRPDEYTVERDEKDSLGDPKWVKVISWVENSHGLGAEEEALSALVGLVKMAVTPVVSS